MSVSLQVGTYRPVSPMSSKLGTQKAENKKPVKIAFHGDGEQAQSQNKPAIKNDEFEDVSLQKRLGKFFTDIGKAFQTLFSKKGAWRFDAVVGQFQKHGKRISSDKEAEDVLQALYQQKRDRLKTSGIESAATPEEKREEEKALKQAEEAIKNNTLVQCMFTEYVNDTNKLLSAHTPQQSIQSISFLTGSLVSAKAYMQEMDEQTKNLKS